MITVLTESGSTYEFDGMRVRRVNETTVKRADDEWVALLKKPIIEIGSPMVLMLSSLAKYGVDDYGTEAPSAATTRMTTRVTQVTVSDS